MATGLRFLTAANDFATVSTAPDATVGILVSGFSKITRAPGGYPYTTVTNTFLCSVLGTNWRVDGVTGNLVAGVNSATDAPFNANTQLFGNAIYVNDYSFYLQTGMAEDQSLGWVWNCWQIIINGTNDIILRQWLKFGNAGNFIFLESIVTVASVRTAIADAAWTPGAATSLEMGNGGAITFDATRLRVEQFGTLPSDVKLSSIYYNDTADTSAWADYACEWVSGAAVLTDRSGHGRNMVTNGGAFASGATTLDTNQILRLRQSPTVKLGNLDLVPSLATLGSALSVSFSSLPTAGTLLILEGMAVASAGTLAVTDNQSGSWTIVQNAPASGSKAFVAYCIAPTSSGTYTVTAAGLGTNAAQIQLSEWTGNSASQPDWSVNPNTNSAGFTITSGSADSIAGVLISGSTVIGTSFNNAFPPGTSSAVGNNLPTAGQAYDPYSGHIVRKLATSIATESLIWPAPSAGNIAGVMVGFKPALPIPIFTTQPANASAQIGLTARFAIEATNATSYQWQVKHIGGAFANISGATSASYTTSALTASANNGDLYLCNATSSGGTTASSQAALRVWTTDVYLRTVPSDANPNDVRLWDPTYFNASPSITVALTGNASAFAVGTLGKAIDKALTGNAGTFASGSVVPNLSLAVTGNAGTFAVGSLAVSINKALTGQASTFAVGSLVPSVSVGLTGIAGTFAVGTPTGLTSITAALTGNAGAFAVGAFAPSISVGLAGNAGTFAVGTPVANTGTGAIGSEGVSSGGGMTGWDGKIYRAPQEQKALGYNRIYFSDTQARQIQEAQEIIEIVKTLSNPIEIFDKAVDVVDNLKTEITRLQCMEGELSAIGREFDALRAKIAIEQMRAQIEEIDVVFMMMVISSQIH